MDNLFYQMRVKLRAEAAGRASISWENGQILLRYAPPAEGRPAPALLDLGPDVRRGKSAYWCSFAKKPDWPDRLLATLTALPRSGAGSA